MSIERKWRLQLQRGGTSWARIDGAAFGIVYGAITVLSILMATGHKADNPFQTSIVLFGSVFAITLAKAFAGFLANALQTGQSLTRIDWRQAWAHSAPTLATANLPTLLFVASGAGLFTPQTAGLASQCACVVLLALIGARVGWVVGGGVSDSLAGGVFSGFVGLILALMKYLIH